MVQDVVGVGVGMGRSTRYGMYVVNRAEGVLRRKAFSWVLTGRLPPSTTRGNTCTARFASPNEKNSAPYLKTLPTYFHIFHIFTVLRSILFFYYIRTTSKLVNSFTSSNKFTY